MVTLRHLRGFAIAVAGGRRVLVSEAAARVGHSAAHKVSRGQLRMPTQPTMHPGTPGLIGTAVQKTRVFPTKVVRTKGPASVRGLA